jgi:hypothetical protein
MRVPSVTALPPAPRTRTLACLVGGAFLITLAAGLVPANAAPVGATEVRLHDDDGGAALFASDDLHPGRLDRACVALSVAGSADPSDQVRLSAEVSNADLAPYLMVTVERGSVGRFGSCASFTGEALWSGTLADFPATASAGILTGWRPGVVDRVTYRFTVTVADDSRAQHRGAAAAFVWTLDEADDKPEPAPRTGSQPQPTPRPSSPPTDPVTAATPSGTEAPPSSPAPGPPPAGEPPSGADDVVEAPPLPVGPSSFEEVIEHVVETARSVVRDGHFPVVLAVVLVAFLTLQSAVDRRDPKLALARLQQDLREFRPFPEPSRTEDP